MLDNSEFWQRFRLAALLILIPVLMGFLVFLVSYFSGREKLEVNGSERIYYIHLPKTYEAERSYPVVLVFHMRMGNAWMMQQITHFNQLADQNEFIILYLDGFGRSWADVSQRYEADKAGVNDVQFVKTLLANIENLYAVDTNRIYVTGFSNGGFFAHRLGCELSSQISAMATVSSVFAENVLQSCDSERNISVLMMHGSSDQDMGWEGKYPDLASVPRTMDKWIEINQCDRAPVVEAEDKVDDGTAIEKSSYAGCKDGSEVILNKIEGGGHKWPSGSKFWQYWLSGRNSQEIDASSLIWAFLKRNPSNSSQAPPKPYPSLAASKRQKIDKARHFHVL